MSGIRTRFNRNRLTPGSQFTFRSAPRIVIPQLKPGRSCGMVALPWGPENKLISVRQSHFQRGTALNTVGLTPMDREASKHLRLLLVDCEETLVFRADTGGNKASSSISLSDGTTEDVEVKYAGEFGNEITLVVVDQDVTMEVITMARGNILDRQNVMYANMLRDNDFINLGQYFSNLPDGVRLAANAGYVFVGGTNGTINIEDRTMKFLKVASQAKFRALGWQWGASLVGQGITPQQEAILKDTVRAWAQTQNEQYNKTIQVVMASHLGDAISLIKWNPDQGGATSLIAGETYTVDEIPLMIASMRAGAGIMEDLSGDVFHNVDNFDNEFDDYEVEQALQQGYFVANRDDRNRITVARDQNSFRSFNINLGEEYADNVIITTLFGIQEKTNSWVRQNIQSIVPNNPFWREFLGKTIRQILREVENLGGVSNVDDAIITVDRGAESDMVDISIDVLVNSTMRRFFFQVNTHISENTLQGGF